MEFASAHQYFCTYLFLLQLCEHELCMHFDTLHICCTRLCNWQRTSRKGGCMPGNWPVIGSAWPRACIITRSVQTLLLHHLLAVWTVMALVRGMRRISAAAILLFLANSVYCLGTDTADILCGCCKIEYGLCQVNWCCKTCLLFEAWRSLYYVKIFHRTKMISSVWVYSVL